MSKPVIMLMMPALQLNRMVFDLKLSLTGDRVSIPECLPSPEDRYIGLHDKEISTWAYEPERTNG